MAEEKKNIVINLKDFDFMLKHELKYLEEFFKYNNEMIESRNIKLNQLLKTDIEENPSVESYLREMYYHDYVKIPSYFYHSSIVSLFSLLENNLNSICKLIQSETEQVIGLKDLMGSNTIQKARKFLILFAEIDFSLVDKEWQRITDFQKLRNLIVHQNWQIISNEIDEDESVSFRLLKRFQNIDINRPENKFYITDVSILFELKSLIEVFISNISNQISETIFYKMEKAGKYLF